MDISGSEWSSGCESGWTLYLDESSESPYQQCGATSNIHKVSSDYEEDMSMVSDASSAPPHFQYRIEEEEEVQFSLGVPFSSSSSRKSKMKNKTKEQTPNNQHSFLDDTASSPAFNYPVRSTYPSHNPPSMDHLFASHWRMDSRRSAFDNQFGHRQSSNSRQQHSTEPSWSRERRRC